MTDAQKQQETENKLIGLWQNRTSNYLWDFRVPDDDGRKLLIVMDERKPTPGSWHIYYNVMFVDEKNIFLELWMADGVRQIPVKWLADNLLELQNPPLDNAHNAHKESIILNKV